MRYVGLFVTLFVAGAALSGCVVPQSRYETALERAREEQSNHRAARALYERTEAELRRHQSVLGEKERALGEKERALTEREVEISRLKLEADAAGTAKAEAVTLVDQLREELARTADHLRQVYGEKRDLEKTLVENAEAAAAALEMAIPEGPESRGEADRSAAHRGGAEEDGESDTDSSERVEDEAKASPPELEHSASARSESRGPRG